MQLEVRADWWILGLPAIRAPHAELNAQHLT